MGCVVRLFARPLHRFSVRRSVVRDSKNASVPTDLTVLLSLGPLPKERRPM